MNKIIKQIKSLKDILPVLMVLITRKERYRPQIKWSSDLWVHNIFRVYEMVFGRRFGVRCESSIFVFDGKTSYKNHTFEAKCAYLEARLRDYVKGLVSDFKQDWNLVPRVGLRALPFAYQRGAIGFDSSGIVPFFGTTLAFTVSGSDGELFVGAINNGGDFVTGITYNGTALTLVDKFNSILTVWMYSFHLVSPSTGTNNIVLSDTASGASGYVASSYTGCQSSGVLDAHTTNTLVTTSTYTATLTTVAANACMVAFIKNQNGDGATPVTGNLRQHNGNGFGLVDNFPLSAGSNTCAYSGAGSTGNAAVTLSFVPSAGVVSTVNLSGLLSLLGVGN